MARRIRTFKNQTMPLVDVLAGRGLVSKVDANREPDEVFGEMCEVYEKFAGA